MDVLRVVLYYRQGYLYEFLFHQFFLDIFTVDACFPQSIKGTLSSLYCLFLSDAVFDYVNEIWNSTKHPQQYLIVVGTGCIPQNRAASFDQLCVVKEDWEILVDEFTAKGDSTFENKVFSVFFVVINKLTEEVDYVRHYVNVVISLSWVDSLILTLNGSKYIFNEFNHTLNSSLFPVTSLEVLIYHQV